MAKSTSRRVMMKIACVNALCSTFCSEVPREKFLIDLLCTFLDEDEQQFFMLSSVDIIYCTNIEAVTLCGFSPNTKLTSITACSLSLYILSNSLMFL